MIDIGVHMSDDSELRKGVLDLGGKSKVFKNITSQFPR